MSKKLLSRVELIELWTRIAEDFGSTLGLPVDNGSSLVLKFEFESKFGETEVKLADLASHSNKHGEDTSSFKTSISTQITAVPGELFKLTLPPLFPGIVKRILKDASIIKGSSVKYWLRTQNEALKEMVGKTDFITELEWFDSIYSELTDNELLTSTSSFLGKREELTKLINLHYSFLKFLSSNQH